jgi:SAM-dependent methyltransferase
MTAGCPSYAVAPGILAIRCSNVPLTEPEIELPTLIHAHIVGRRVYAQPMSTEGQGASFFRSAPADQYDRWVGRYGAELARTLIATAGVRPGQRALDVGSGPGALTRELAAVLGADNVAAVDPSPPFAEANRERNPGVDVRMGAAESLPFDAATFDHALAQLVVNFMADAHKGVGEMSRVTRPGGRVSAAVWDYREGMTLLRAFWDAVVETNPAGAEADEGRAMLFATPRELKALWQAVGLRDVETSEAIVSANYESFADLWQPLEAGVGPAGVYVLSLSDEARAPLKDAYRRRLNASDEPFRLTARSWLVTGRVA